ncbi:WXG100 family type VII secretion target [Catenulispora rubra]|uniref:WXG100 family type VII secretion target n=1 Tax=Catenulispora rubra TaxID=280293 RepID=UPI001892805A|nr:WXG100 family type VII secretion target [Catenulispora rubra]
MATYMVNMNIVQQVAEQMGQISSQISDLLTNLEDSTQTHLSEWSADSQQAYWVAKKKWDEKAADMAVQATNAEASLGSINESYANAENQGLGLWEQ